MPRRAIFLMILCLAAAGACNQADGDAKSEPTFLPEDFTAENNPDNGNTQIIFEGFIAEPNPTPPDGQDDDRFIRTVSEEEPALSR